MLSNTAVPKYYGMFRQAVMDGKIPVCETVVMEMNRIDNLIRNPRYFYDDEMVDAFVKFCEGELVLTDGSPMVLLDSFKLWAESILGWYYYDDEQFYVPNKTRSGGHYEWHKVKKRLINKQYLIVSRGAAKSVYMYALQSFYLAVEPSTTKQITVAPTLRQADAVLAPIRTSILRARGPYYKFLTQGSVNNTTGRDEDKVKLFSTKKGAMNRLTGSTVEPLPMDVDKLQGYGAKVATIDEWLSGDIREDVIDAIEQGSIKNGSDYIIIAASSEGTIRNAVGDTIKMEIMNILTGKYQNDHVSIWYYKLDNIKEIGNPDFWLKANPNLGKTVQYSSYQEEVKKAENEPAKRNDIVAKLFGIPMEGCTYFFTYEETKPTKRRQEFWQMQCSLGVDLSRGDDFCAFTFLFPLDVGAFGIKTRCYITQHTLDMLPLATKEKYIQFMREGSLVVMDNLKTMYLDIQEVYDDLDRYIIENEYDVQAMGYDPAYAKEFIERWVKENGERGIEKVIQGAKTESVPLGELKNLAKDKLLWFDQMLMSYGMGNCVVMEDSTNGMRKLKKERRDKKIDAVSALMDAWVAYKLNKDNFM